MHVQGNQTLADYMKDRTFPFNLETYMFGRVLEGEDSTKRSALIIKQILRQIITSLKKIHDTGIVHRDVKPANLVLTKRGQIKLIDFGAATDLRIGKNYVPKHCLILIIVLRNYMYFRKKHQVLLQSPLLLYSLQFCGRYLITAH